MTKTKYIFPVKEEKRRCKKEIKVESVGHLEIWSKCGKFFSQNCGHVLFDACWKTSSAEALFENVKMG